MSNIKHPAHYADGRKYEPIKVIRDWELNFNLGNTVKYISRAGRKGDIIEDLEKARYYLEAEIEELIHEQKIHTSTKELYMDGCNERQV